MIELCAELIFGILVFLPDLVKAVVQELEYVVFGRRFVVPSSRQRDGKVYGILVERLNVEPATPLNIVPLAIF